jgi:hypothetical protein
MRLFIAERPALAKVIADGVGGTRSANRLTPAARGRLGYSKTKASA